MVPTTTSMNSPTSQRLFILDVEAHFIRSSCYTLTLNGFPRPE